MSVGGDLRAGDLCRFEGLKFVDRRPRSRGGDVRLQCRAGQSEGAVLEAPKSMRGQQETSRKI